MSLAKPNTSKVLCAVALSDATPVTGLTSLRVQIIRTSDRFQFDFDDATFKNSGWTTLKATLTQMDAANAPGVYYVLWVGAAAGEYVALFTQTGSDASNFPQILDLDVGGLGALDTTTVEGAVWGESLPGSYATGTAGERLSTTDDLVDTTVSSRASHSATDVWAVGTRTLTGIGSSGIASQASVDDLPTAAQTADAVLDEVLVGHTTTGTTGEALGRLDVAVSTRAAPGAAMALTAGERTTVQGLILSDATPFQGGRIDAAISSRSSHSAADIWGVGARTLTGIGSSGIASQASVDAIPAAPAASVVADAVWDELLTGHATAGSAGAALALVDVAVSSRATAASVWATAEGTPALGTMGYPIVLFRKWIRGRLEVSTTASGQEVLYDDDGTTPLLTWPLRDGTGDPLTAGAAGSPARRGAAA